MPKKVIVPKVKWYIKVFNYLKPLWEGNDGKISVRNSAAVVMIPHFMIQVSRAFFKWEAAKSLEGGALLLGVEAGLIAGILGLAAYTNLAHTKIDAQSGLLEKPSSDTPPENNRPTE